MHCIVDNTIIRVKGGLECGRYDVSLTDILYTLADHYHTTILSQSSTTNYKCKQRDEDNSLIAKQLGKVCNITR